MSDLASAARLLGRKGRGSTHHEECWRTHSACCLVRCGDEITTLKTELQRANEVIEAQLKNLIEANSHNHTLMRLVRSLRDVNADLDQKLCSGSVSGADCIEGKSPQ